jgi:hypothetical protein
MERLGNRIPRRRTWRFNSDLTESSYLLSTGSWDRLSAVQVAIRLHELQRMVRGGKYDRDQIVWIKRDPADQFFEFLHRRRRSSTPGAA